jgi:hypothetical protein
MPDNIFDEGATTPEPVVPPVVPAQPSAPALQIPQELADLVGEGKKYKSVEDALKSIVPAQSHIARLEQEAAARKADLEGRKTFEELLEELKSGTTKEPTSPNGVTQDILEQTIASVLSRKEAQSAAQANTSKVVQAFQAKFGDKAKAEEMYVKIAEESGMSVADLNTLAARSPAAVLKLAGIGSTAPGVVTKPNSSVNTEALTGVNPTEQSAVVKMGASTKDVVNAWKVAEQKVLKRLGNT